jgi:transglutaminase-like putative cysteine protease
MDDINEKYLAPTSMIDSDHPLVRKYAGSASNGAMGPADRAVRLYYAVRDGIWYDPYCPFYLPEHYRASNILKAGRGYCVCKASVLCAAARASGIPARLGFADVKNHLATRQLLDFLGSDIFVFHGYVEFLLGGKWVKATPAFNRELCERHQVEPLEFNGADDSVFQPFNLERRQFMEYVTDHGTFADVPIEKILEAWKEAYGEYRVQGWIESLEKKAGEPAE